MASIETRKTSKGSTYRVVWRDSNGKKHSKTWGDMSRAELWKNLIETVDGDTGRAIDALARQSSKARTVSDVSQHRLELIRATVFTMQTYESYMRNHIGPAFGNWPIDSVTEDDCRRFIMGLERKGLSPKYIGNIAGWLTSIMGHAVDRGWRVGNPMKPEMLPAVEVTDEAEHDKFLTRAEAFAIIEKMPIHHQLPALLMLSTGLRPAELRALKVSDVYLDAAQPVVRVTKAIKHDRENGDYVGPPKSPKAVRSLGLPGSIVGLLQAHVAGRSQGEYLFPGKDGRWIPEQTFYLAFKAGVKRAREAKQLTKNPVLYSLRHSHASMMIDNGMDIYKLSRHLGHASVQTTEKVYLHLYPDAVYQAAQVAAAAIGELPRLQIGPTNV